MQYTHDCVGDAAHVLDNLPATEDVPQWMIDKGKEWTPELWDKLHEIAMSNPSVKVRMTATKQIFDRVYGKPAVRQRIEGGVEHRHFVLRAPTVIEDAGAWEAHASAWQAADRAHTIDLKPEPPPGAPQPHATT